MRKYIETYVSLASKCRSSNTNLFYLIFREVYYRIFFQKKMWLHQNVLIRGTKNIYIDGRLIVGVDYVGFSHKTDKTYLNINGKLVFKGSNYVGRGCRFDIGADAVISIGEGGYINVNSTFIIMNGLIIGDKCLISWGCQFLDDDNHSISYQGRKVRDKAIKIGDKVWIGCGCKIYKGTIIPNNCVIAADSVVSGVFNHENCLIAGNPAKIIKENVSWQ
jgi:acetyltransferase-like isoleucine patch superfamily enzyme